MRSQRRRKMINKFWNFKENDSGETELIFNGPIAEESWLGDVRSDRV